MVNLTFAFFAPGPALGICLIAYPAQFFFAFAADLKTSVTVEPEARFISFEICSLKKFGKTRIVAQQIKPRVNLQDE